MVAWNLSRRPPPAAAMLALAATALLAAGCGDSNDGGAPQDDTEQGQNGMNAYLSCLAENGVELQLPSGMPGGRPSGMPGDRPSGWPSGRPTDLPSGRPSGAPPSGLPGGGGPGGGMFGKPEGVSEETWQKAQEACAAQRPSGGPGRQGGRGDSSAAYRNCLRENGVTGTAAPDPADATAAKALETCQVLSPAPSPSA